MARVRGVIRRVLKTKGYQVEEAGDGKIGVEMYDKNTIDLVITDIVMPNKEGLETIRELRKINPDVKIIAVSGGTSTSSPSPNSWVGASCSGTPRALSYAI